MDSQGAARSYGQYCSLACALDILGDRWTLLVVRELLLGPLRYTDLLHGLPGIGTNLLARRLRDLERASLVERRTLPPPAGSAAYALTRRGQSLEPAIIELGRFGGRFLPTLDAAEHIRSRWAVVGLKLTFRPARARSRRITYQLNLDRERYVVRVDGGVLHARQGEADEPDSVISTSTRSFLELLSARLAPSEGLSTGAVALQGSIEELTDFVRVFGWGEHEADHPENKFV
jgi:DNA-binding HxlR family transcriptional regulator